LGFTVAALALSPQAAHACSDLPNICEYNDFVFQQNQEMARDAAEAYAEQVEEERQQRIDLENTPPPNLDPMGQALAGALQDMAAARAQENSALLNDPKYRAYMNGEWSYFQDDKTPKPGEYCAAFFARQQGFVMLTGPGGDYEGALLTFWGADIPRPKKVRQIKVTLKQSNDKPQTVTAFNYFHPEQGLPAIALAVPSIQAALAGVDDKQSFELVVGGKTVAKVAWQGGNAMKKKLGNCVAKRRASN
jgi:hypothetical protein